MSMSRFVSIVLATTTCTVLPLVSPALADCPASTKEAIAVDNIADDFVAFWDRTRKLPTPERVVRFKLEVSPLFPAFYGAERFEGRLTPEQQDERIAAAIEGFPAIRDTYLVQVAAFDSVLTETTTGFVAAFPGFRQTMPIHLAHTLGEMDGGLRTLEDERHLIFGPDVLATSLAGSRPTALFQHELFHVYHETNFARCEEVWCSLWREGLAVYVSRQLNPDATPQETGLEYYAAKGPDGIPALTRGLIPATDGEIAAAWKQLQAVLDSAETRDSLDLFQYLPDSETGLTPRRGYYLGYLVARRIGATRDLETLAAMTAEDVRPLILAAVAELVSEHVDNQ